MFNFKKINKMLASIGTLVVITAIYVVCAAIECKEISNNKLKNK